MINFKKIGLLIPIAFSLLITACSSSGTMVIKQPMTQKILPDKSVSLSVGIITGKEQESDFMEVQSRVRERLFGKLLSEGIFKSVVRESEPSDYIMDIMVTDARVVSGAARVMVGVMAGHNDAGLDVKLTEREGNRLVTAFSVDGTSASHPFSSETSLDDAIREAVNNIVRGLRQ